MLRAAPEERKPQRVDAIPEQTDDRRKQRQRSGDGDQRDHDGTGGEASYAKGEEASSLHGTFHAPFDGRHGWFWQNLTWEPVTVKLKTSGFYAKIEKL